MNGFEGGVSQGREQKSRRDEGGGLRKGLGIEEGAGSGVSSRRVRVVLSEVREIAMKMDLLQGGLWVGWNRT